MKTKQLIINNAITLFNTKGIKNVTLREIAATINKSYGNVTYHFATKEQLLVAIFEEYNETLVALHSKPIETEHLLHYFMLAPAFSFDITVKYLFLFVDYTEIKRAYPAFISQVEIKNQQRKQQWKGLLLALKKQEFLKNELLETDLDFIMELSIGLRMYYFQSTAIEAFDKKEFSKTVNRLLFPYLSEKGKRFYGEYY